MPGPPPDPQPPVYESRRSRRLREQAQAQAQTQAQAQAQAPTPEAAAKPVAASAPIRAPRSTEPATPPPLVREQLGHPAPARIPAVVLPAVAALLLVVTAAPFVGDVSWGPLSVVPVGLASLSPLLVVPALLVITLAVRRRAWIAVGTAAVAAIVPWGFVVGYVVPAAAPRGPSVPLRALLITAEEGDADAASITAAAREQAADLVVVTELSPRLAHDLTAAGLTRSLVARYVSVPDAGPADAGIAIFSRYPVDAVEPLRGTRWPAVRARVTVGTAPLTLVAGHTGRPSSGSLDTWRHDLRAIGEATHVKGPVLVLANLNATPWNPQFRRLVTGRLHDAGDVLGHGLRPTWPSWSPLPLLPTDHALVAGLGVTSLGAVVVSGTDHRALSVELQVPTTPSP